MAITRADRAPAVVVSLAECESPRETAHLLHSPVNARRLFDAVSELDQI